MVKTARNNSVERKNFFLLESTFTFTIVLNLSSILPFWVHISRGVWEHYVPHEEELNLFYLISCPEDISATHPTMGQSKIKFPH